MKELQWTVVDKSEWERGPWDEEPDKKQWIDPLTGLPCLIVRGPSGALCGYVGVSEGHPYFEKGYDDVPYDSVSVHGGLTFCDHCHPNPEEPGRYVCHVVEDGDDDNVWWFGFDCAHAWDLRPGDAVSNRKYGWVGDHNDVYRDFDYVTGEVTRLAHQLKAQEHAQPPQPQS